LVVAIVKGRPAVGKGMFKKMHVEKYNLKTLNEEEVKEQYRLQSKISLQLWNT
jgi:hypothetical protein